MTDIETRRATELIARRIRDAHQADEPADPDVLAAEVVALMRARGWRHLDTLSTVPNDMRTRPRPPSDDYRHARQRLGRPT